MDPYELDLLVDQTIRDHGAMTISRLARTLDVEADDVRNSIIRLVSKKQLTWVTAMPRQGIFFTRIENRGKYGFGLMAGARKGVKAGERQKVKEDRKRVLQFFDDYWQGTADEIAEIVGLNRDTTLRHLKKLAAQGKIKAVVWPRPGRKGRRPLMFTLIHQEFGTDELPDDAVLGDPGL
jgi:predicted ArsR family transcriptional regulator